MAKAKTEEAPTTEAPVTEAPKGTIEKKVKHQNGEYFSKTFDFGADLETATSKFGEAVVYNYYLIGASKAMRDRMFSLSNNSKSPDSVKPIAEVLAELEGWQPTLTVTRSKKSTFDRAIEAATAMSDEERKALIAELMKKTEGA